MAVEFLQNWRDKETRRHTGHVTVHNHGQPFFSACIQGMDVRIGIGIGIGIGTAVGVSIGISIGIG